MFKTQLLVGVSSLALVLAMSTGAKADQTIDVGDAAVDAGALQDVSDNNISIQATSDVQALLDSSMHITDDAFKDVTGVQAIALNTGANAANAADIAAQVFTNDNPNLTSQRIAASSVSAGVSIDQEVDNNSINISASGSSAVATLDSSMLIDDQAF